MKRVSLDAVRAAYLKTGLRPQRGSWFRCALGALLRAQGTSLAPGERPLGIVSRILGLRRVYIRGFVRGFDRAAPMSPVCWLPAYRVGYADGERIARAVFDPAFQAALAAARATAGAAVRRAAA